VIVRLKDWRRLPNPGVIQWDYSNESRRGHISGLEKTLKGSVHSLPHVRIPLHERNTWTGERPICFLSSELITVTVCLMTGQSK
jgi:hypothetical protein